MNVYEAVRKWNVKETTVIKYICNKYIFGLYVEDGELQFPDIPKPYVKRKPKKISDIDKYILKTLECCGYANAVIMGITEDQFEERIKALLSVGEIYIKDETKEDFSSTLNVALVHNYEKNTRINISPTIEVKLAEQIGVVNGKVGV